METNNILNAINSENVDEILYHCNTFKLEKGKPNEHYAALREILGNKFKNDIKPGYEVFINSLRRKKAVLDIGCGDGSYLLNWAEIHEDVKLYGVDNRDLDLDKSIEFKKFNILEDPVEQLPDADFILMNEVLHLFSDGDIKQVYHKLSYRFHGKMLIITENKPQPYLDERLRRLSNGKCLSVDYLRKMFIVIH